MIRLDITDGVATVTLDRGGASNAFALRHWDELRDTAERVAQGDAHVVVLRSARHECFSAGADLTEMSERLGDPAFGATLRHAMGGAIEAIAAVPVPVVAAIDGACFGAAVALVLACDVRIAGPAARFATPPARLGISYPSRDVARLSAQIGRGQAARLLLVGEVIDGIEAARIGLVEAVATDAGVEAMCLARMIATNDADAVGALKRALAMPEDPAHDATFERLFTTPAFADRLSAFHRRPR